ncbi:HNH nuclease domain-containing protein OS=Tsukamurella paurometabola (strain ATCC 8368 / DSM/ CCUG 35730 / CIP 100753 / JCM 10117 / KCTC 9821 / NBRC 16120/ NCIMB 702349 / NCTC 13040) OX=521096 GN=Tpau_4251 PE=4 SV=1 [Tsukamurella paurometabola]|uniref:HNH nuclease domain-containing protein n=1 Tax=Tsukamurella paurometabola (strain ATCC 8368 / DSM 20162 / CCUG 35730 / CIP 100753 / JCM 10117 / KCTC 9821 / NBRC 16120 / NCIMB 702349 / NCTC 13040) TaxID=521096 RepID=D5UYX2_TSUPD|nr:hypothetical protein [Tsukamurella paurometabola]ADG80819.1 hypothetical protein Tpau_4251 [Tsukamurella paurometabola DSM 20162]SUQ39269.1 Uncharacterised protein [Tsukamurella paurometabola]
MMKSQHSSGNSGEAELVQLAFEIPGLPAVDGQAGGAVAPGGRGRAPRRAFTAPPPAAAVAAFAGKLVTIPTGCLIFTGAISTPDGYGRVTISMPGEAKPVTVSAHRFALWAHQGQLPADGVLEHHCNEPLCVRVAGAHVHPSTQSANLRHAISSGRHHNSEAVVDSSRRAELSVAVRELTIAHRDGTPFDLSSYRRLRDITATAPTLPLW